MPHTIHHNVDENKAKPCKNPPHLKDENELNRLIASLTHAYEDYAQIEQRIESKNDPNSQILNLDEFEDHEHGHSLDDEIKGLNQTRADLYQSFINAFDELSMYVRSFKMDNLHWFKSVFQIKKLAIIQLYEFINKLLKIQVVSTKVNFDFKGEMISNFESKAIIVKVALQFLHILTTSKN